jgi:hypothetical protein
MHVFVVPVTRGAIGRLLPNYLYLGELTSTFYNTRSHESATFKIPFNPRRPPLIHAHF